MGKTKVAVKALSLGFSPWQLDAMRKRARVVIVGEQVGKTGGEPLDGKDSKGRERRNGSGWRFARLLGTTPSVLKTLPSVLLTNLFSAPRKKWDKVGADIRAVEIMDSHRDARLWILLGSKVAEAFGMEKTTLRPYALMTPDRGEILFIHVPHPSGRNLFWNSEYQRRKAKKLLRALIAEALNSEKDRWSTR